MKDSAAFPFLHQKHPKTAYNSTCISKRLTFSLGPSVPFGPSSLSQTDLPRFSLRIFKSSSPQQPLVSTDHVSLNKKHFNPALESLDREMLFSLSSVSFQHLPRLLNAMPWHVLIYSSIYGCKALMSLWGRKLGSLVLFGDPA